MKQYLLIGILLVVAPASASEPGQPLDCSDWVAVAPGINCEEYVLDCTEERILCHVSNVSRIPDNEGRIMLAQRGQVRYVQCGGVDETLLGVEVLTVRNGQQELIGHFEDRCTASGSGTDQIMPRGVQDRYEEAALFFDEENGSLYIALFSRLTTGGYYVDWVAKLTGFATTFEVMQSYDPSAAAIGFSVPYMPEGFQYADWFDTYWGDLASVGDWSQAQGLQCGFPATAPQVGNYLTVPDTLPTPASGQGYYYVTSATYEGQTRYGRQAVGGQLTGRDPAILPICDD